MQNKTHILCSLVVSLSLAAVGAKGAYAQDATYTFTVTAKEGGAFNITAVVSPLKQSKPVPLKTDPSSNQARPADTAPGAQNQSAANQDPANENQTAKNPANTTPAAAKPQTPQQAANTGAAATPVTKEEVQKITREVNQQLSQQFAQKQQQLVDRMQQQQAQLTNRILANQRTQAQQVANAANNAQRTQQQAADQIRRQLQAQQTFMANAYQQFMRDQATRNFDRNMMGDPNLRRMMNGNNANNGFGNRSNGNNGSWSQLRQLANQLAGGGNAQGQQGAMSSDETTRRLEQLSSSLPDEVAQKVVESLKKMEAEKADVQEQFAKLNEQLALLQEREGQNENASKAFSPDDYEHFYKLGELVENQDGKRVLFEMALEAAGRVAGRTDTPKTEQRMARDFALKLAKSFRSVKSTVTEDNIVMRDQLEYDVEKCMRISGAEDFYSTSQNDSLKDG